MNERDKSINLPMIPKSETKKIKATVTMVIDPEEFKRKIHLVGWVYKKGRLVEVGHA